MSTGDQAVREIFETVNSQLTGHLTFDYGTRPDINKFNEEKITDLLWMFPLMYSGTFEQNMRLFKSYSVQLYFCRQDSTDSSNEQRRDIVESMDDNVTQFLIALKFHMDTVNKLATINSINVEPFFSQTTDVLTGKSVSFTLVLPDDFEYCD